MTVGGSRLQGPLELLDGLMEAGPKDLTIACNNAGSGRVGLAKLMDLGRVRKIICSFPRSSDPVVFESLYRAGKIKLLGVASAERSSAVPEVPTIAESGLPGFRSITWFALAGPPGLPAELAQKINRDIDEILRQRW